MKLILFLSVILLQTTVFATVITDKRGQISIETPKTWSHEENLFGLPHVFISSEIPKRSTMSLTLTGLKKINLVIKDLESNQTQYQEGRKKWALKRNIKINEFFPYRATENIEKIKIHTIGMQYAVKDQAYFEKSYYIECPKTFVHLKLVALKSSPAVLEAEKMVTTLRCHVDKK